MTCGIALSQELCQHTACRGPGYRGSRHALCTNTGVSPFRGTYIFHSYLGGQGTVFSCIHQERGLAFCGATFWTALHAIQVGHQQKVCKRCGPVSFQFPANFCSDFQVPLYMLFCWWWFLSFKKKKRQSWKFIVWYLAAKRNSPAFHAISPWSHDLSTHKSSQLPEEHTARLPLPAHRNYLNTQKPSLSYQVPTYSWIERVHVWGTDLA